jgi:hypothetical protein
MTIDVIFSKKVSLLASIHVRLTRVKHLEIIIKIADFFFIKKYKKRKIASYPVDPIPS